MSKALEYIKQEILKLHQVAAEGKEDQTATAAREFLTAMGMNLPMASANVPQAKGSADSVPEFQNSMNSSDTLHRDSIISESTTQNLATSTASIGDSLKKLKAHCKDPLEGKPGMYGSTKSDQIALLHPNFDLPQSIKMGKKCGCPVCDFVEEKRNNTNKKVYYCCECCPVYKNKDKKVDYCCECCPVYKNKTSLEEELKQDFVDMHKNLDAFFDSQTLIGVDQ